MTPGEHTSPLAEAAGGWFPFDSASTRLVSPLIRTLWPVFLNGRYDAGQLMLRSFHAVSAYNRLVSGSFYLP